MKWYLNICQTFVNVSYPNSTPLTHITTTNPVQKISKKGVKIEFGQIIDMDSKLYRYPKKCKMMFAHASNTCQHLVSKLHSVNSPKTTGQRRTTRSNSRKFPQFFVFLKSTTKGSGEMSLVDGLEVYRIWNKFDILGD